MKAARVAALATSEQPTKPQCYEVILMVSNEHTGERYPTQEAADCAYLRTMLSLVDVDDIVEKITPEQGITSGLGRKALARGPIVKALLAGRIEGYETQSKLISQLAKNPALRRACGFDSNLPSRRTFGRVFKELRKPEITAMLESEFDAVINRLKALFPDLGVDVSVDATTVQSYTRRKPLSAGSAPRRASTSAASDRASASCSPTPKPRSASSIAASLPTASASFRDTRSSPCPAPATTLRSPPSP